jgi:hypothetical protein
MAARFTFESSARARKKVSTNPTLFQLAHWQCAVLWKLPEVQIGCAPRRIETSLIALIKRPLRTVQNLKQEARVPRPGPKQLQISTHLQGSGKASIAENVEGKPGAWANPKPKRRAAGGIACTPGERALV